MQPKYWIIVASQDHVMDAVAGHFCMANHGKKAPLEKMKQGDGIIYYSPKETLESKKPLQAFTAVGTIADDLIYQHKMTESFVPYRRNVSYLMATPVSVSELIEKLNFIENKPSWGYQFRFGFFEINADDYLLIRGRLTPMSNMVPPIPGNLPGV